MDRTANSDFSAHAEFPGNWAGDRNWIRIDPKVGRNNPVLPTAYKNSVRAAHSCPTIESLESRIRPATSRVAFFENVRKENPFPTAENPLRLVSAMSCSTRNIVMSDFILTFDEPSDMGRRTSMRTLALAGGQVAVKINTPLTLMSRVSPSAWKHSLSGPVQWKTTAILIRYRLAALRSAEDSDV
jgi:hypothetical protein